MFRCSKEEEKLFHKLKTNNGKYRVLKYCKIEIIKNTICNINDIAIGILRFNAFQDIT